MSTELINALDIFSAALRKGRSINVNDQGTKDQSIALAQRYFSEARPAIIQNTGETEELAALDELWQRLVRLAHGNNYRRSYVNATTEIRRRLSSFNISLLTVGIVNAQKRSESGASVEERLLLETLDRLVPTAAASYRQGIDDLGQENRISFRGTALEFREALRETLDHLAPDNAVMAQPSFKLEEKQTKPTMKQKARYVLNSRGKNKTQRETAEKTIILTEELAGEIARAVYNNASLAAHVQQSKSEVIRIKRYVDTVLFDLLELGGQSI